MRLFLVACFLSLAAGRASNNNKPVPVRYGFRRGGGSDASAAELQELLDRAGDETACILAVGAKWCEPCQALKPLLTQAAEASAGTLIVKYVDVDVERGVADALQSTQLPTLYVVRNGQLVDMQVGMPQSTEQLGAFVMRAMTQDYEMAGATPAAPGRTQALARVVGHSALGAGGRERLQAAVRAHLEDAKVLAKEEKEPVSDALKTVVKYLSMSYNGKPIFLDNDVYKTNIASVQPAVECLIAAGYVLIPGDPEGEDENAKRDCLHPSHRNLAAFELCAKEIESSLKEYS